MRPARERPRPARADRSWVTASGPLRARPLWRPGARSPPPGLSRDRALHRSTGQATLTTASSPRSIPRPHDSPPEGTLPRKTSAPRLNAGADTSAKNARAHTATGTPAPTEGPPTSAPPTNGPPAGEPPTDGPPAGGLPTHRPRMDHPRMHRPRVDRPLMDRPLMDRPLMDRPPMDGREAATTSPSRLPPCPRPAEEPCRGGASRWTPAEATPRGGRPSRRPEPDARTGRPNRTPELNARAGRPQERPPWEGLGWAGARGCPGARGTALVVDTASRRGGRRGRATRLRRCPSGCGCHGAGRRGSRAWRSRWPPPPWRRAAWPPGR